MPTAVDYLGQAKKNESFYDYAKAAGEKHRDWATVVLFYCALHYVNAVLSIQKPVPPFNNHSERGWAILRNPVLRPIRRDYRHLKDHCNDARYGLKILGTLADVEKLRVSRLERIKATAVAYLKSQGIA